MTRQFPRLLSLFAALLLFVSACAPPPVGAAYPAQSVDAIYTAAAQTLQAQLTLNGVSYSAPTLPASSTPSPEPTSKEQATRTSLATITPLFTPTRPVFFVAATQTTNCRKGPGLDYEKVGSLQAGAIVQVYGTNDSRTWWMIQNPSNPYEYCWVWDQTTQIEGDPYRIPNQPAPELPTATATPEITLKVAFASLNKCDGSKSAIFKVDNTSPATLHSLTIQIIDLDKNTTLFGPSSSDAPFLGTEAECPPGGDSLPAGERGYVAGTVGMPVPHGHRMQALLEFCTDNGQEGACVEKTVNFTVP